MNNYLLWQLNTRSTPKAYPDHLHERWCSMTTPNLSHFFQNSSSASVATGWEGLGWWRFWESADRGDWSCSEGWFGEMMCILDEDVWRRKAWRSWDFSCLSQRERHVSLIHARKRAVDQEKAGDEVKTSRVILTLNYGNVQVFILL